MTETNLERMYRAGKVGIPDHADLVSRVSADFHAALEVFDQQAALAGDPSFLRTMLEIGGTTYGSFRSAVTTLNNCATAVLLSADHYVQTDDGAATDLDEMDPTLAALGAPVAARVPPELADPGAPGSSDGTVGSTPTPDPASVDARQRETNEEISRYVNNRN